MGAVCLHTQSDEARELTKELWDAKSFGWGCTNPDAYGEQKVLIEKLCAETTSCTPSIRKQIKEFMQRSDEVLLKILKKRLLSPH